MSEAVWWHGNRETGRLWIHLWALAISLEFRLLKRARFCCATLSLGGGDTSHEVVLHLAIPWLFSLWLGFDHHRFPTLRDYEQREMGVRFYEGILSLRLWHNVHEWHRGQPWWWEMSVNVYDLLLGEKVHSREELGCGTVAVVLPEGEYMAKYTVNIDTWKRPRWFAEARHGVTLDFGDRPVPIPGKGESEWDLDDDAIYTSGLFADNVQDAVMEFRRDVKARRQRYGGADWRPQPMALEEAWGDA